MKDINLLDLVTLASAVGSALIAGSFFAFSTFVMGALGRLPAPQGIAAMQSIDIVVINPFFMTPFVGTALLCLVAAGASIMRWHDPGAAYLLAGAVLYVAGTFLVTMLFNVPKNEALARVVPSSPEGAQLWARYLPTWTAWNHVRTIAAAAAMVSFIMALRVRG